MSRFDLAYWNVLYSTPISGGASYELFMFYLIVGILMLIIFLLPESKRR